MSSFYTLVLAFLLALTIIDTQAQQTPSKATGSAKGIVRDTVRNYVLKSATVSIHRASDSTLLSYQISNIYGEFNFSNLPINTPLNIEISHVGYHLLRKKFTIPAGKNMINLQTLIISPRDITLKDVVISIPPISMNGDTLEFNAAAFKLDSNAVVEDLLRKIPNITMWGDGQITVNGREVKNILVNGKPFFGGSTKIATQNIPKNAIEKIQVYRTLERKVNPLDSTLEINLKLKKKMNIGYFGKVGGGYGTHKHYDSDANLNVFTPRMELALVGAANNINKGLNDVRTLMANSTFKGTGTNVEYQSDFRSTGLNQSKATGVSFTYNFIESPTYENKSALRSDYFIQSRNGKFQSEQQTTTTINNTDKIVVKNTEEATNLTTKQKFSSNYQWTKNRHSLTLNQSFNKDHGRSINETLRTAENAQNVLTSTNNTLSQNKFSNSNVNVNAKYQSAFDTKKPRSLLNSFIADYTLRANDNQNQRLNITKFSAYTTEDADKTFNRKYDITSDGMNHQIGFTIGNLKSGIFGDGKLQWIDLSFNNKLNIDQENSKSNVKDLNKNTNIYENNEYLSNKMRSLAINETPALNLSKTINKGLSNRYTKSLTFTFSPKQQFIYQKNRSDRAIQNINRTYSTFVPEADISYRNIQFGEFRKNYTLGYSTMVSIPNIQQLAPLTDSTNLYYLQKGNLKLKEAVQKSISLSYSYSDLKTKNTLNYGASLNAGITSNGFTDSVLIDDQNRRTIYFVNSNGNKFLTLNGNIRKALKLKTSEIQLNVNTALNITKTPGYTNSVFNYSNDLSTSSRFSVNYTYKDYLAIEGTQSLDTYYSRQEAFNTEYSGQNYATTISSSYNVTKKITVNSNVRFNSSSSSGASKAINFTIWNASVMYRFLKGNNAEFKLSALDLLHENNSVINYGNANSFTIGTQNVLEQYFLVTLAYYPRQFGTKGAKK